MGLALLLRKVWRHSFCSSIPDSPPMLAFPKIRLVTSTHQVPKGRVSWVVTAPPGQLHASDSGSPGRLEGLCEAEDPLSQADAPP